MAGEKGRPDFTIGMACFENFDEVFFTVQSLRFHHAEIIKRFEIVVVDNSPASVQGRAVRGLIEKRVAGQDGQHARYIPFPDPKGSVPPRAHLYEIAAGKFTICIDSHVLLEPGVLQYLADYFAANPDSDDLLHGPLVSNFGPQRLEATHMVPVWRSEMFGTWGVDERGRDPAGEPFEIKQHGLGLFAARTESFLGFPPNLKGFSGGEGYIHEKYRQAGRRVLCLPGARWVHKFSRPLGVPHRPNREDKIRNHIRGWMELGVDIADGNRDDPLRSMANHYVGEKQMTPATFEKLAEQAGFPDYRVDCKIQEKKFIAVCGPTSFGSFKMRADPVCKMVDGRRFNSRGQIVFDREVDICLAVKCNVSEHMRKKSKRVIFEPLDSWFVDRRLSTLTGEEWVAKIYRDNKFDDLIVSTFPLKNAAEKVLPKTVRVWMIPHHADPRVGLDWHDPEGPIVYAGHRYFVEGHEGPIREAAKLIGREVVIDYTHHSWQSLKGASLVLAPRLESRSPMNLIGKPTVKLANASQAGIPALATDDPAALELFPDLYWLKPHLWEDPEVLSKYMELAIEMGASVLKYSLDDWLERMRKVIECESPS